MNIYRNKQDAFGREIFAHLNGREAVEIIERDDGYLDLSGGPQAYFAEYPAWPAMEKEAISLARGRVLDVGCGAGRVGLYLQSRGLDVTGIDNSPLAVRTCRQRGYRKARVQDFEKVSPALGRFDTVVMFGNNFGLFGSFARARRLLRRLHGMTGLAGRIVAQTLDPYQTGAPEHLAYHRRNRRRGRMGGQIRLRVRFRDSATPYFDYLLVSRSEMQTIVRGTGWKVSRFVDGSGPTYAAVLEKEQ
jgi:SAM-dependent methyltransferase